MNILITSTQLPAGKPAEWNRVATEGEWLGYHDGPRKLSADDIRSCVAFHDEINGPSNARVCIDYEHAIIRMAAGQMNPKDVDAAGWIEQLEARQGEKGMELWQRQLWTATAEAKIVAGEKRYLSPVILQQTKHPVTGKPVAARLHSVALTVEPFFRHLGGRDGVAEPAIAASDALALLVGSSGPANPVLETSDMELKKLCVALGLPEAETEAEAEARIAELRKRPETVPLIASDVATLLGVEPSADLAAVTAAVEKIKKPADPPAGDATLKIERTIIANQLGLDGKAPIADLQAAIGRLVGSASASEAENVVNDAIKAGRLRPADRETMLGFAQVDLPGAKRLIAGMTAIVGSSGLKAPADDGLPELTPEEEALGRKGGPEHLKKMREVKKARMKA